MSDKFSTEVIRRVYNDSEGVYVEVAPDDDGLGFYDDHLQIRTTGKSAEYYGEMRLTIPVEMAEQLACAILGACKDAKLDKESHGE